MDKKMKTTIYGLRFGVIRLLSKYSVYLHLFLSAFYDYDNVEVMTPAITLSNCDFFLFMIRVTIVQQTPRPSSYPLLGPKYPLSGTIYPQFRVQGGSW